MAVNYVHLIPNLEAGGAERQLCNLALAEHAQGLKPKVIVFASKKSALWYELENAGVEVLAFPLSGALASVNLIKLVMTLIKLDANNYVLAAWMYHASFISIFVKLFNRKLRIFWMIRRTAIPKGLTGLFCRFNALFSNKIPDVVVANSAAGLRAHVDIGYSSTRFFHIPNIIDCERFAPVNNKLVVRNKLNLPADIKIFACIARYAPVKGHLELLKALSLLKADNFVCLLLGRSVKDAEPLASLLTELQEAGKVMVLGEFLDVASIMPALDFLVMPSLSEGFPNVVAEAMASGVPCIVTDVGDAAEIVSDTGIVVPPANTEALATAIAYWLQVAEQKLTANGSKARRLVNEYYSLDKVCVRYRMLAEGSLI